MRIAFSIPLRPQPKQRARSAPGGGRHYTPQRTRDYEAAVKLYARQAIAQHPGWPLDASYALEVFVHADCCEVVVTALPRAKRAVRGDLDNIAKSLSDSFNGAVWADDRLLVDLRVVDCGAPVVARKGRAA